MATKTGSVSPEVEQLQSKGWGISTPDIPTQISDVSSRAFRQSLKHLISWIRTYEHHQYHIWNGVFLEVGGFRVHLQCSSRVHLPVVQLRLGCIRRKQLICEVQESVGSQSQKTKVFLCLIPGKPCNQKWDLWEEKCDCATYKWQGSLCIKHCMSLHVP